MQAFREFPDDFEVHYFRFIKILGQSSALAVGQCIFFLNFVCVSIEHAKMKFCITNTFEYAWCTIEGQTHHLKHTFVSMWSVGIFLFLRFIILSRRSAIEQNKNQQQKNVVWIRVEAIELTTNQLIFCLASVCLLVMRIITAHCIASAATEMNITLYTHFVN